MANQMCQQEVELTGVVGSGWPALSLWDALASLKHLQKLTLLFDDDSERRPNMSFFKDLSILRSIRLHQLDPPPHLLLTLPCPLIFNSDSSGGGLLYGSQTC